MINFFKQHKIFSKLVSVLLLFSLFGINVFLAGCGGSAASGGPGGGGSSSNSSMNIDPSGNSGNSGNSSNTPGNSSNSSNSNNSESSINLDPIYTATGTVKIPSGVDLNLSDLYIETVWEKVNIDNEGKFTIHTCGKGNLLIPIRNKYGKIVLYGYANTDKQSEINSRSTAAVLLFYALTAYSLPPNEWDNFINIVMKDSSSQRLSEVIENRMKTDPTAVSDNDSEIKNLLINLSKMLSADKHKFALFNFKNTNFISDANADSIKTDSDSSMALTMLNIQPDDWDKEDTQLQRSGITPYNNNALVIGNKYRRYACYYVHETKYIDSNSKEHSLEPMEKLYGPVLIEPSVGFQGVTGTIQDYFNNDVITYQEKYSEPFEMPLKPIDAKKSTYQLIAVGPGHVCNPLNPPWYSNGSTSKIFEDGKNKADLFTLFYVQILPLMASFGFPSDIVEELTKTDPKNSDKISELLLKLFSDIPDFMYDLRNNDYKKAFMSFVSQIIEDDDFRDEFFNVTIQIAKIVNPNFKISDSVLGGLKKLSLIVSCIDFVLYVADVVTSIVQTVGLCEEAERWTVDVVPTNIPLNLEWCSGHYSISYPDIWKPSYGGSKPNIYAHPDSPIMYQGTPPVACINPPGEKLYPILFYIGGINHDIQYVPYTIISDFKNSSGYFSDVELGKQNYAGPRIEESQNSIIKFYSYEEGFRNFEFNVGKAKRTLQVEFRKPDYIETPEIVNGNKYYVCEIKAFVYDPNGNIVPGVKVDFTINGPFREVKPFNYDYETSMDQGYTSLYLYSENSAEGTVITTLRDFTNNDKTTKTTIIKFD